MKYKSVLPPGWYDDLLDRADLDASFAALAESSHFYVDAMRGRIRSLQLRIDEAWEYLDRAARRADDEPVTVPNLARRFLANLYLFENALVAGPVDRNAPAPEIRLPEFPENVIRDNPEVRYVVGLRLSMEGYLRLHLGDYHRAGSTFQALVDSCEGSPDAAQAIHYCGLAAAQHNLGLEAELTRTLESAGLALISGGKLLNRVRAASTLVAFSRFLGRAEDAAGWREYMDRLACPCATKEVFLRRGEILLERCAAQKCLLLL